MIIYGLYRWCGPWLTYTLQTVWHSLLLGLFCCVNRMVLIPHEDTNHNCLMMFSKYGVAKRAMVPPPFQCMSGRYSCYTRTHPTSKNVGQLTECSNVTHADYQLSQMKVARLDIWWDCGTDMLRSISPTNWTGTCTPVPLVMVFILTPVAPKLDWPNFKPLTWPYHRQKRPPHGLIGYIIAGGFKSLLIWVSPNKNAEWINYFFYNQQRFVNYTTDAIKGSAKQPDAITLIARQNRLALDMIPAEKGGTCNWLTDSAVFIQRLSDKRPEWTNRYVAGTGRKLWYQRPYWKLV